MKKRRLMSVLLASALTITSVLPSMAGYRLLGILWKTHWLHLMILMIRH